jgi:hypothetical protein
MAPELLVTNVFLDKSILPRYQIANHRDKIWFLLLHKVLYKLQSNPILTLIFTQVQIRHLQNLKRSIFIQAHVEFSLVRKVVIG